MAPMTDDEHAQVTDAIRAAESRTSGEIYCVVARSSASYFFPSAAIVLASILLGSFILTFLLEIWWVSLRLPWFVAAQMLAALCALLLLWTVPRLRIVLVPHRIRHARAHDNALRQFLARNVHRTAERTGVLIFVSLEERYAEVVADSGISEKADQAVWNGVVATLIHAAKTDRLADGFVEAVGTVGALLAEHFPVSAGDDNELDDHLVEI